MFDFFFKSLWRDFLSRPRIIFRALGSGARRRPSCTLRRKFIPRPGPVASALGVQSRASWLFFKGSLSAEPELSRAVENPHETSVPVFFRMFCCV